MKTKNIIICFTLIFILNSITNAQNKQIEKEIFSLASTILLDNYPDYDKETYDILKRVLEHTYDNGFKLENNLEMKIKIFIFYDTYIQFGVADSIDSRRKLKAEYSSLIMFGLLSDEYGVEEYLQKARDLIERHNDLTGTEDEYLLVILMQLYFQVRLSEYKYFYENYVQALHDYKKVIDKTNNPKLTEMFNHVTNIVGSIQVLVNKSSDNLKIRK